MTQPLWRLTVSSEFCASHALRHYNGKCEHIHGHNFAVDVCVQGTRLSDDTELLLDFTLIKKMLKETLEHLDHKDLNTTPPFDTINPSSENLARYLYLQLKPLVLPHGVAVYSVTVAEKKGQSATYLEC